MYTCTYIDPAYVYTCTNISQEKGLFMYVYMHIYRPCVCIYMHKHKPRKRLFVGQRSLLLVSIQSEILALLSLHGLYLRMWWMCVRACAYMNTQKWAKRHAVFVCVVAVSCFLMSARGCTCMCLFMCMYGHLHACCAWICMYRHV